MNAPADAPLCGMDIRSAVSAAPTCSLCSSAESCSNSTLDNRSTVVGSISSPLVCAFGKTSSPRADRLDESVDEVECRLGDLAPPVVDRERVASVRDLHDLRHGGGALLPPVGGGCGRPPGGGVLLALR